MNTSVQTRVNRSPIPSAAKSMVRIMRRQSSRRLHTLTGGESEVCMNEQMSLQRYPASHLHPAAVPHIVHEVLRSPGQPLDPATRAFMEPRFSHDFSHVRVHTDARAADSAQAIDALAYAVGQHVVFGPRNYAQASMEGKRLLAHELTHVVQQARTGGQTFPANAAEREAEQNSERVTFGRGLPITQGATPGAIQRQTPAPSVPAAPEAQPPTDEFAVARSIGREARDERRDIKARAVEAVWRIIHEYFVDDATKVRLVAYDDDKAGTGLHTYEHRANNTSYGEIYVGKVFLEELKRERNFARAVLQVGHELGHVDQYRSGMRGRERADEREFLAFYHEALGVEKPHTGRMQHTMRIQLIDTALGYYNCLSEDPKKKRVADQYASDRRELLNRRAYEITDMRNKGYGRNVPTASPPSGCVRQPGT